MNNTHTASTTRTRHADGFQPVLAAQLRHLNRYAVGRTTAPSPDHEPVDMDRLLGMVDDEPSKLREVVGLYLDESERAMRELWASVQTGNWEETENIAHRLGGTSATCGMVALTRPLRELEVKARAGRWSTNQALLLEAGRQHDRVIACLEAYGLKKIPRAEQGWKADSRNQMLISIVDV